MTTAYGNRPIWQTQLPVDYKDTSLVINTWENVSADLSGGKPTKLNFTFFEQTNNGATDEDIELEITINGTAYTITQTAVSGTVYYVYLNQAQSGGDFSFVTSTSTRAFNGQNIASMAGSFIAETIGLIRVRQTTNVDGTSAQIEVNIIWDKLVEV